MHFRLHPLHLALIASGAFGLASCATVAPSATDAPTKAVAAAAATDVAAAATQTAASITDPKSAEGAQAVAASARAVAATAVAAAAAGGPPAPKPFADIIKDAKEEKGYFTTWRKDDKVWIEIPEAMWERPLFLLGERDTFDR